MTSDATGAVVRLVDVRDAPLSVDEVLSVVSDPACGGTALFVGAVREQDGGRGVTGLGYTAHTSVVDELRAVAEEVAAAHPEGRALAAVHRVGDLAVGDLAVVVGVSCAHRGDAFMACRALIDELKSRVPIWKHQVFADGGDEWVGLP
jgi:molybdopterin synthase catalytic subunit